MGPSRPYPCCGSKPGNASRRAHGGAVPSRHSGHFHHKYNHSKKKSVIILGKNRYAIMQRLVRATPFHLPAYSVRKAPQPPAIGAPPLAPALRTAKKTQWPHPSGTAGFLRPHSDPTAGLPIVNDAHLYRVCAFRATPKLSHPAPDALCAHL